MTKYLHIVCDAGLANRLHAIVGAQDIAHVTGRELIIHWPVNRECGAPFKRLFKNPVDSHGQPRYTFATREHVLALLSTRTCVKVYNCGYHNLPTETDECYRVAADPPDLTGLCRKVTEIERFLESLQLRRLRYAFHLHQIGFCFLVIRMAYLVLKLAVIGE